MDRKERKMKDLTQRLTKELKRCRKLLEKWRSNPNGSIGAMFLTRHIFQAEQAISKTDLVEMVRTYKNLKDSK